MSSFNRTHRFYLFALRGGGRKLAYGASPEDALEVLAFWHTQEEMDQIIKDDFLTLSQRELPAHIHELA
ncbi:MAG: hypothetical protein ABSH35_36620 [Isosphaeraceae bacterium]|jgi:hypothetical protein